MEVIDIFFDGSGIKPNVNYEIFESNIPYKKRLILTKVYNKSSKFNISMTNWIVGTHEDRLISFLCQHPWKICWLKRFDPQIAKVITWVQNISGTNVHYYIHQGRRCWGLDLIRNIIFSFLFDIFMKGPPRSILLY